jgi:hypothetical protein
MSSLRPFKVTSASQISKFRRCNRNWWWNKIRGIYDPAGPGAVFGTKVHNHMEAYFKDGVIPPVDTPGDEGRSARDAQRLIDSGHYPTDVKPEHVEPKVWLTVPGMARPVVGKVDVLHPQSSSVYDHKTLKNFKWKKTEQELLGDEQALIYGAVAIQHGANFPIHFSHIYVNTTNGKVEKVTGKITEELMEEGWKGLMETTDVMVKVALVADPKEVAVNSKACGDYGGCNNRERCMELDNIGGTAGFAAKLASTAMNNNKEKKMGLTYEQMKAKLNKRKPGNNGAITATPTPVIPTVLDKAPPQAEERLAEAKNVTPAQAGIGIGGATSVPSAADIQRGAGVAVNPPDGTPATEVVKPKVVGLKKGEQSYQGKALRSHLKDELVALYPKIREELIEKGLGKLWSAHTQFVHAGTPFKGKRIDLRDDIGLMLDIIEGRIASDAPVPAPATDPNPPTAPTTGPDPLPWKVWRHGTVKTHPMLCELAEEPTVEVLRASFGVGQYTLNYTTDNFQNARAKEVLVDALTGDVTAEVKTSLTERTLYIGCHPRTRQVEYMDHIVADAQRQVALDYGKDHYHMLDYGTGPKAVAAEVARAVREGRLTLPERLVVDSKHPCAQTVLDVILPHYQHIIERYG